MTEHALGVNPLLDPSIEYGDSLIESMLDGFSVLDAHGVHVKVNEALCQMTGFKKEDLIGIGPPHPYWPSEELDSIQRAFDQTKLGDHRHYELLFTRKNGERFPVIVAPSAIRNKDGITVTYLATVKDITARKQAETELQQGKELLEQRVRARTAELERSEAKYRALVESCPDAVAVIDLQGRIIFASPRVAEQQGTLHPDELVGRQAVDFLVEEDRERFNANIRCLMREGIRRNDQYRVMRENGTLFDVEISSAVIRDAAGTPEALMGVYRDVTDRKRVEEKLRVKDAEVLAAAEIQARLLPQESPQVPGFDIAGRCYPAEAAAGDHFDYLWRPDGSLLIVMGDVSGHGLGPAIVAADFCARLRTLAEIPCELPKMAEKVNSALYRETDGEIFVTTFLGRLDPQARSLTFLNAGHPPAIILNSAGEIKSRLSAGSCPLAIAPETPFIAEDAGELTDGDLILFYTDGLVEVHRRGQPLFGTDRALQVVRAHQTRTAAQIIEALHDATSQYAGTEKPKDDITVVVVKVLGHASGLPPVAEQPAAAEAAPPVPETTGGKRDLIGTASFHADHYDGIAVIRFVDTKYFNIDDYAQLQKDLVDFVECQQPRKLLVDLGRIEYCSTALISGLLMAQRRVTAAAGTMKLFGLREVVLETLQHLKLVDTMLSVYADETGARDAV